MWNCLVYSVNTKKIYTVNSPLLIGRCRPPIYSRITSLATGKSRECPAVTLMLPSGKRRNYVILPSIVIKNKSNVCRYFLVYFMRGALAKIYFVTHTICFCCIPFVLRTKLFFNKIFRYCQYKEWIMAWLTFSFLCIRLSHILCLFVYLRIFLSNNEMPRW